MAHQKILTYYYSYAKAGLIKAECRSHIKLQCTALQPRWAAAISLINLLHEYQPGFHCPVALTTRLLVRTLERVSGGESTNR